jgi:TPR repeat protein
MKWQFRTVLLLGLAVLGAPYAAVAGQLEDAQTAYNNHDFETAVKLWRPLTELGDAEAQEKLGKMYILGKGFPLEVTSNPALCLSEARRLFRLSADQGNTEAMIDLGSMYETENDYEAAIKLYRTAAEKGNAHGQAVLAGASFFRSDQTSDFAHICHEMGSNM